MLMCQGARDSERFPIHRRRLSRGHAVYAADTPFGVFGASYNITATKNGAYREIDTRLNISMYNYSALLGPVSPET